MPRKPSRSAQLHRDLWLSRLSDVAKVDTQTLLGMALQASDASVQAHRHDLEKELRAWADWLSDPIKATPGKLHRITKPSPRFEDEYCSVKGKATSPLEIVDAKTEVFKIIWSSESVNQHDSVATLARVREHALQEPCPCWTLEQLDQALRLQPDRGRGVDKLVASDVRRLPTPGRQAFVDLINSVEEQQAWPYQLLQSIIMLEPKKTGDRALALIAWVIRCWQMLTRPTVDQWVDGAAKHWDSAIKGSSRLREALARALQDEAADALAMASAVTLADIERFYDSLEIPSVAIACERLDFPKRVLSPEWGIRVAMPGDQIATRGLQAREQPRQGGSLQGARDSHHGGATGAPESVVR